MFREFFKEMCVSDICRKICDCCYEEKKTALDSNVKYTIRIPSNIPATVGSGPPSASTPGSGPPSASSTKSTGSRSRAPELFVFPRIGKEGHRMNRTDSDSSSKSLLESSSSVRSRFDSTTSSDKSRNGSCSSPLARFDSTSSIKGNRSPFIDMKPIEFFPANRENVQPKSPRFKTEASFDIENFQKELYDEEATDISKTEDFIEGQSKLGEVHFVLRYDVQTKKFHVRLVEARDLPKPIEHDETKCDQAHSNPYVKICLHPNTKDSQQSSVQRKTQNPVWNETFSFSAEYLELQNRLLEITVKDFDKFSRHCVIGEVQIPLSSVDLIQGKPLRRFLLPCPKKRPDLGEILTSINYLPSAGRLNVDIIRAHQLLQTDIMGGTDPFVKVALLLDEKMVKIKKTSTKKNTIDPMFNECLSFTVNPASLSQCNLVISVCSQIPKSRDSVIGRIVLGKYSSGSHEASHWLRMVSCQRSPVAQWHLLKPLDECHQCSPASVAVP